MRTSLVILYALVTLLVLGLVLPALAYALLGPAVGPGLGETVSFHYVALGQASLVCPQSPPPLVEVYYRPREAYICVSRAGLQTAKWLIY